MELKEFKFVYVDTDYLHTLYTVDKEILYATNSNYEHKPHLGILIANGQYNYVIPLTSAKPKHKKWRDITATNYRIYETIDTRKAKIQPRDIIVEENNHNKLRDMNVLPDDYKYYKKRILSILEIKKMFPVPENKYTLIDLYTKSNDPDEEKRRILMLKEYFFCRRHMNSIIRKATNIYEKQMSTNIIEPFYCNYRKLEEIADETLKRKERGDPYEPC